MTSTIRVSEPRELLALIPHQLGFVPTNSMVLVSLREPRSRVGLVARVDLEDLSDSQFGPQLARSLVAHLDSDRASRCILVCYTSVPLQPGDSVPTDARVSVVHLEEAIGDFFPVEGRFIVDPERFHCVDSQLDVSEPGRPLVDLQSTAVGAQMVMAGNVVASDRDGLGLLPTTSGKDHRVAAGALQVWSSLRVLLETPGADTKHLASQAVVLAGKRAPRTLPEWRVAGLRLWRHEVDRARTELDAHTARARPTTWGRLAAALEDVVVRDAALLALVVGSSLPEDSLLPDDHDTEIAAAIAAILDPVVGHAPNPHVVGPSNSVLRMIVAHAPNQQHAPAATLLALIAWWEGKGAQASVWLERAQAADPEYRLAGLLAEAINSGMPPGWVRQSALEPEE